jgi:hypothetical protein
MSVFEGLTIGITIFCFITTGLAFVIWNKLEDTKKTADLAKQDAQNVKDLLSNFQLTVTREYPVRNEMMTIVSKMDEGFKHTFSLIENMRNDMSKMGDSFRDRLDGKVDKHHVNGN